MVPNQASIAYGALHLNSIGIQCFLDTFVVMQIVWLGIVVSVAQAFLQVILIFATPKLKARYQPTLRLCRCHIMAQRRTGNIIHVNHLQNCLLSLLDMEINMGIHLHGQ